MGINRVPWGHRSPGRAQISIVVLSGGCPKEYPLCPRHWQAAERCSQQQTEQDPPPAPDIPDSHMSFLREMPAGGHAPLQAASRPRVSSRGEIALV
jgi:hypothetical protein